MSIEERDGILDHVSEKGIILSGARLSYSKWFEGQQPSEDALGCQIRVIVDAGTKCTFLKRIVHVGQKSNGWKPAEAPKGGFSGGGGGRRFSPEELDLKREEGIRIARSVAIDRAITMAKEGIPIEKVASLAQVIEEYVLKGKLPGATMSPQKEALGKSASENPPLESPAKAATGGNPSVAPAKKVPSPAAPAKPKRLASRSVNLLFNEARQGGLVADWSDYLAIIQNVLKVAITSPYHMGVEDFAKVESFVRSKLGRQSAA